MSLNFPQNLGEVFLIATSFGIFVSLTISFERTSYCTPPQEGVR
jgi:hypothetical protein